MKESDNNVKLIVLDRLISLKAVPAHEKVLQVHVCHIYIHIVVVKSSHSRFQFHHSYYCILTFSIPFPSFPHSQDLVMDILRVLSSPDLEVRKKTLSLVLDLITTRTVEEVRLLTHNGSLIHPTPSLPLTIPSLPSPSLPSPPSPPLPSPPWQIVLVLKKEVASTSNGGGESVDQKDVTGYRQSLVRTLHHCSIRFASVAPAVVPLVSCAPTSSQ